MLKYCWLDLTEQISVEFQSEIIHFHSIKWISICHSQNGNHFCLDHNVLNVNVISKLQTNSIALFLQSLYFGDPVKKDITSSKFILVAQIIPGKPVNITGVDSQGLYSLSGKTSYHYILWTLESTRLNVIMITSLWNLTGISAALLPRCQSNFRAIEKI